MRHFRRLYFDNPAVAGAFETYISIIDRGRDGSGQPFYNIKVGNITSTTDLANSDLYLQLTSCFFKLPVGATAVVDIYAPDLVGSTDPLSFDYQVFKAKPAPQAQSAHRSMLSEAIASEDYSMEKLRAVVGGSSSPSGPRNVTGETGPTEPDGPTGPSGPIGPIGSTSIGICTYPGGCHGQTSVICDEGKEPLFYSAVCHGDGSLTCELFEPDEERRKARKK